MKSPSSKRALPKVCLVLLCLLLETSAALAQYSVDWYTIDGGGGLSTGMLYSVQGTIGQPDVGPRMNGVSYSVDGGFWSMPFGNPPIVLTDVANLAVNSATLNAMVDPGGLPTSVFFQWGTTTNYGNYSATNQLAGTSGSSNVAISISGLASFVTYHYRVVAISSAGTAIGDDASFESMTSAGGTWTPLTNLMPAVATTMLLQPDGTVLVANIFGDAGRRWFRLTPDSHGSYVNGSWSEVATMNRRRLYYTSFVLQDGRVFVAGGEYGNGPKDAEVFDPFVNTWTIVPVPPALASTIVDAIGEMLPNGSILIAPPYPYTPNGTLIFDPHSNTISAGPNLLASQGESTWVKLPDDSILTIDINTTNSERYIPSLNKWIKDADLPMEMFYESEIGASFVLPNGKGFFLGGSGHTAIYTPSGSTNVGTWTAGADIPDDQCTPDAPGAMMMNGKILCTVSPVDHPPDPNFANPFLTPTKIYEYDYLSDSFTRVNAPGNSTIIPDVAYGGRMLDLPDGSVLFADFSSQLYVYKPSGAPLASGKPSITTITQNSDFSYHLVGTKLNGISVGASYGDDNQMDSNYPLIRLTNSIGEVYYCRTYNWSRTSIMTGNTPVSTEFVLPENLRSNTYGLVVVANGIASDPVSFIGGSDLRVTPMNGAVFSGYSSGPFGPAPANYTLTNIGTSSFTWTGSSTSSWLTVSPSSGTLSPGGTVAITIGPNVLANSFVPGDYFASVVFADPTNHFSVTRAFQLHVDPALDVSPVEDASALGQVGGPFDPLNQVYSLTNRGQQALTWAVGTNSNWLNVSLTSGVLAAGSETNVTLTPNTAANLLPYGDYTSAIWFTNQSDGFVLNRNFLLQVRILINGDFQLTYETNGGVLEPVGWTLISGSTATNQVFETSLDDQSMVFLGPNSSGVLRQVIPTIPGGLYLVSWELFIPASTTNYFGVFWNGVPLFQATNIPASDGFVPNQVFVTASTFTTTLDLAGHEDSDISAVVVDNVDVVPVARPVLLSVARTNNSTIQFAWSAVTGLTYQVQFATNLSQSNWSNLGSPIVATNSINLSVDTIGPDPRRFYRVKILP